MTAQQLDQTTRYQQLRRAGNELGLHIAQRIPKEIFDLGARRLGLLRNDFLVMDTAEDQGILIDYCIYDVLPDGKNQVELATPTLRPPPGSDLALFLEAMRRPHYSIFEVTSVERVGVRVNDRLFGGSRLVVDEGLATTANEGASFAARLLTVDDITMTSGAVLPLNSRWLEVLDIVINQLGQEYGVRTLPQFNEAQRRELTSTIIYSALSFGATRGARFMGSTAAIDDATRLGRNDACPCGSGQPFGICCGRRG